MEESETKIEQIKRPFSQWKLWEKLFYILPIIIVPMLFILGILTRHVF